MEKFEYANEILKSTSDDWKNRFQKFSDEITKNGWTGKNNTKLVENILKITELANQSKKIIQNQEKMISDLIEAQKEF